MRHRTLYASAEYLQQRLERNMTEREANQRSNAIRERLLKRGVSIRQIREVSLDNPFMTEDARNILVKLAWRKLE